MLLSVGTMALHRGTVADDNWALVVTLVLAVGAVSAVAVGLGRRRRATAPDAPARSHPTVADEIASWLRAHPDGPTAPDPGSVDPVYFRERERGRVVLAFGASAAAVFLVFESVTCFCSHTVPGAVFGIVVAGLAWWSARRWHRVRVAAEQVSQRGR